MLFCLVCDLYKSLLKRNCGCWQNILQEDYSFLPSALFNSMAPVLHDSCMPRVHFLFILHTLGLTIPHPRLILTWSLSRGRGLLSPWLGALGGGPPSRSDCCCSPDWHFQLVWLLVMRIVINVANSPFPKVQVSREDVLTSAALAAFRGE